MRVTMRHERLPHANEQECVVIDPLAFRATHGESLFLENPALGNTSEGHTKRSVPGNWWRLEIPHATSGRGVTILS
jgi:hypothetical protein